MAEDDSTTADASRGWAIWPFRVAISISAVLLFNQAVFAGRFLSGSFGALQTHRDNATYAGISMLVAAVAAVILRWPGGGPLWPLLASLGLFALIGAQIAIGFARVVTLHVPLGVTIIVLVILVTIRAWRWRG